MGHVNALSSVFCWLNVLLYLLLKFLWFSEVASKGCFIVLSSWESLVGISPVFQSSEYTIIIPFKYVLERIVCGMGVRACLSCLAQPRQGCHSHIAHSISHLDLLVPLSSACSAPGTLSLSAHSPTVSGQGWPQWGLGHPQTLGGCWRIWLLQRLVQPSALQFRNSVPQGSLALRTP